MHTRFFAFSVLALTALLLTVSVSPAAAQAKADKASAIPRLADGHPDLQGIYDIATLTPVDRPRGVTSMTMTKEQAMKLEGAAAQRRAKEDEKIDGNRTAPPKGGDGSPGPYGNVGGYNYGWLDPGSHYNMVDGQYRTSLIIDPADGRMPPYTAEGQKRMAELRGPTSDATESNDPGLEKAPGAYDDPERRPLGERCILGFGSTSGPPMLPDYFYNNLHQIVQTPDTVMILSEMVHDARIVRMNAQHLPKTYRFWMGDSVGHWEGDTLVIDTTNFNDKTRFRGATENLHIIERLTRVDARTLLYRFTVEDPSTWSKAWTGEFSWPATDAHIYEYACHEANYALKDILKGARLRDQEASKTK